MRINWRLSLAAAALAASAAVGAALWPHAQRAGTVMAAAEDPARLSELQIAGLLRTDPALIARNIDEALAAADPDLAESFVALAREHQVALDPALVQRVSDAAAAEKAPSSVAKRFATGLVTGQADDVASLSGTVAGDLFVFGDIRDAVREGKHLVMGEETDRLVLGLAAAGLAVTAATYVSAGGTAPVRAGLTLVKDARKVGRLGEGLAAWAGRSAREVVDAPMLQQAVASGSVLRPGETATAIRAAFRAEKAGALVRLGKDVGRITEKAGTRGALDSLKLAEGPRDVARAARLAEAKGGQTRAILKLLGRGALLLTTGLFNLALWLFGAVMTLFSAIASLKAMTERATQGVIDRGKRRRLRRMQAASVRADLAAAAPCG
ncbi:hypothetical protein [Bradyrhizobium sp. STM 3809]|uniref:hypothetical protein n=1 Tax=Bradyrhizobium sp. STM 3809 TaxID=551936 RepID=UPI0002409D62|nr:hypothetical protein [Bradyrhizobium sp. STM 3809]CCE01905.1 conserved exported hypothetical protein [Bradyrhizobium sp. STM 3809]